METVKKRQKASARREKQQKKVARRLERKNEKLRTENKVLEKNLQITESAKGGPTIL
jgi:hypothetical protein